MHVVICCVRMLCLLSLTTFSFFLSTPQDSFSFALHFLALLLKVR